MKMKILHKAKSKNGKKTFALGVHNWAIDSSVKLYEVYELVETHKYYQVSKSWAVVGSKTGSKEFHDKSRDIKNAIATYKSKTGLELIFD